LPVARLGVNFLREREREREREERAEGPIEGEGELYAQTILTHSD
jgi:hypothetical protein